MSITRDAGCIVYECDRKSCHETIDTGLKDFREALGYAKEFGWSVTREGEDYFHYCSVDCRLGRYVCVRKTLPSTR